MSGKPDCILHIGASKTGTSSIQRVLGARRAELARHGVLYPRSPGFANHAMLPASLVPVEDLGHFNPAVWEGMTPPARLARFRREFEAEMRDMPADTRLVVISAEQMGGLLDTRERIAALRDLLAPHVGAVTVILYLRRQDSHFASGYVQALRVAAIAPPMLPRVGPEVLKHYDYAAQLDDWAAVFGDGAMRPRIFERESMRNGDAVDDFIATVGLPLEVPPDDADRQSNLSLSPAGIGLVRAVGEHMKASPAGLSASSVVWRRFTQSVSEALPGGGWKPSEAEAAAFLARFEAVNEAVRRRWFPEREVLFAGAPQPRPGAAPEGPAPIDAAAALEAACSFIVREVTAGAEREAQLQAAIGRLHERLGEADQARAAWRAAVRAVPEHPLAQSKLAEAALAAGDLGAAEAHLAVLRRAHPDHAVTARVARLVEGAKKESA